MGYTKKWIPPTIPLRDDLTAWKALFKDVHDNLIAAGLVQTATAGQLDISAVAALPADGSYAGFIEYGFDDSLQATAPVVIKLEYGCDIEGLINGGNGHDGRTPRIRVTISFAGGSVVFGCPQTVSGYASSASTSAPTKYGTAYLCHNKDVGFLGYVYGTGTRGTYDTRSYPYGRYLGATLAMFVARSSMADGTPTGNGLMVYYPGLDAGQGDYYLWTNGILNNAYSSYINSTGAVSTSRDLAIRIDRNNNSIVGGEIQTQQVFSRTPQLTPWPWIVSYNYADIVEGVEFDLQVFTGPKTHFITVGRETSISVDPLVGQRASIAMLWE